MPNRLIFGLAKQEGTWELSSLQSCLAHTVFMYTDVLVSFLFNFGLVEEHKALLECHAAQERVM